VLFQGAVAHLECTVRERHEAGDHTILVCAVDRAATFDTRPLLYFRGEYALLGG
jgi:flavin reductase (DIM6/NTAB) family NADH-FMN oxidoreductase RutF